MYDIACGVFAPSCSSIGRNGPVAQEHKVIVIQGTKTEVIDTAGQEHKVADRRRHQANIALPAVKGARALLTRDRYHYSDAQQLSQTAEQIRMQRICVSDKVCGSGTSTTPFGGIT
jgi:hypothetical protein